MSSPPPLVVFTCSFYSSVEDVRFQCCLETLRLAKRLKIPLVVVDASESDDIRSMMREHAGPEAQVRKQVASGKKGCALREALRIAAALGDDKTLLCWQEAEKSDMMTHWHRADVDGDCVVPMREDSLFQATYPMEQYHSEKFANAYLDSAAAKFAEFHTKIDWHFGPFAMRKRAARPWLDHRGELWDAQVVPLAQAIKEGTSQVRSVLVPFRAPLAMKSQEEGNFAFVEKRLMQINFLDPKVIDALKK